MSSSTLDPLPPTLRQGLYAVALFGLLSLTTTVVLFSCLTYRLLTWYRKGQINNGANQFFILIYNLLIADIQQAIAFALTTAYITNDKIEVGTSICGTNGWFVSVGDLASSVSILAIAVHTFLAVVKDHMMSDRLFYTLLACAWIFIYTMAVLTVTMYPHVYSRAGAWCWINQNYDKARLWLHYFWIFACMLGTVITYALIYISLNTKLTQSAPDNTKTAAVVSVSRYMIVYPAVYVTCTLPLAGGRMVAMTGMHIPFWYYCFAGAAISSCGWLDVLLYIFTRRAFVFSKEPPSKECLGLHTFGWYHGSNFYGTTTIIEGPLTRTNDGGSHDVFRDSRSTWLLRKKRKRFSDEQYFAPGADGVITTKTTVEVTSGPVHCTSETEDGHLDNNEDGRSLPGRPTLYD